MTPRDTWILDTLRLGRRVLVFDQIDSTNTQAAALAGDPANEGIVLLADEQTAGRGQHGRTWTCPPGVGVLMSVLLFPPNELRRPVILAAWAANAVCETIRQVAGLQARIKWPNDVLVRGRKVCGILIEQRTAARGQRPGVSDQDSEKREKAATISLTAGPCVVPRDYTVVGIGLNVNQTEQSLTEAGLPHAGSLAFFTGGSLSRWDVARQLICRLDEEYERLCQGDRSTLETKWGERTGLLGQHVLMECQDRDRRGRVRGLSWGGVVLDMANGESLHLQPETIRRITRLSGRD